ncbi:MAG: DJ-1 family protein, partial [Coprobacillus sp.]
CIDQNIITARGPAAALQFGYDILESLGQDSTNISEAMQYPYLYK